MENLDFYEQKMITYYSAPIWGDFNPVTGKVEKKVPTEYLTLSEVADLIASDRFQELTTGVRNGRFEKKDVLPSVVFQGRFSYQGDSGLREYSGFGIVDVDHLQAQGFEPEVLKQELFDDKLLNVALAFTSPRGDGVKLVVKGADDEADYLEHLMAVWRYIECVYGVECDKSGKNISRACFLCHDDNVLMKDVELLNDFSHDK